MRDTKFRTWDKKYRKFFPVNLIWGIQGNTSRNNRIKDFEFQQYTGLLDKNGKDVYEGDLIKWNFCDYHDNHLHSGNPMEVKWEGSGFNLEPITCDSYEVVGNIWES